MNHSKEFDFNSGIFFVSKKTDGTNYINCEIEISFEKPIIFDKKMECSLIEIAIPKRLSLTKPAAIEQYLFHNEFFRRNIFEFQHINKFLIYSDIVKESNIMGIKANLLRILTIENEVNLYLRKHYHQFKNKLFIPLRIDELNSFKISVRDISGNKLIFNEGSLDITLLIQPLENNRENN